MRTPCHNAPNPAGLAIALACAGMLAGGARGEAGLYPAADCAALWLGYADFADVSAFLEGGAAARRNAAGFRASALRITEDPVAVAAYIAKVRPDMALMMRRYIEDADREARDMFGRLSQTCEDFAATQSDTRGSP